MTNDNASGAGMELPDAWDYAYEWDSPLGLRRSFDYRPYNGTKPDRHVSLFTEEQLRDYAQAHNAKLEAQVERMRLAGWLAVAALERIHHATDADRLFAADALRAALKP